MRRPKPEELLAEYRANIEHAFTEDNLTVLRKGDTKGTAVNVSRSFAQHGFPDNLKEKVESLPASLVGNSVVLRKHALIREGRVVSLSGTPEPLASDDSLRIVTVTTTVAEVDGLSSETDVYVFERDATP